MQPERLDLRGRCTEKDAQRSLANCHMELEKIERY